MKALIVNSQVLAVGTADVTDTAVVVSGVVFPLNVIGDYELVDAASSVQPGWGYSGGEFSPPPPPPANRNTLTAEIDAAVAAITARYAPFLEEYKTREAQAREFAAANFTGTVPQQVAAFATPAGLSAQVATQTIIGQADALRTASDLLGVQRMRKYEVLRAATDTEARTAHADVMATIAAIAAIGAQIG